MGDLFVSGRLDVGGVVLNYRVDGTGPRFLICVHNAGSHLGAWDGVVTALANDFTILRFDLRGHGRSERARDSYKIDDFVRELLALADHVGFEQFDLAGFSLGGLIAQRTALMSAARVRRLVLLGTTTELMPEERAYADECLTSLQSGDGGAHFDTFLCRWLTKGFQQTNPDVIRKLRERYAATDLDCYAAAYRILAETDHGNELRALSCPTLIMTGEWDECSPPRMARLLHERIARSCLEIVPSSRHWVLIESPSCVADRIRRFLLATDAMCV